MNLQEAKTILEMCRAGGQDAADPQFAEVLAMARTGSELAEWFARQQAFDAAMSTSLKSLPVPKDLKGSLLAQSAGLATTGSTFWRRLGDAIVRLLNTPILPEEGTLTSPMWHRWPVRLGAIVLVIGVAAVPALLHGAKNRTFVDYMEEIVMASWNQQRHLEMRTRDLAMVRQWLANQSVDSQFVVPSGLSHQATLHGASVLEWQGSKVAFLCYLRGPQHLHLLVADRAALPNVLLPDNLVMGNCNGWTTFSWIQDNKAYVLTGLRMQEFIQRFRKGGRWHLNGHQILSPSEHSGRQTPESDGDTLEGGPQIHDPVGLDRPLIAAAP